MRTIPDIRSDLRATIDAGIKAGAAKDSANLRRHESEALKLADELKSAQRNERIRTIGGIQTMDTGTDLGAVLLAEGFDRKSRPSVTVEQSHALGIALNSGSVDGGIAGNEIAPQFVPPALGVDNRYLYPRLVTRGVDPDSTGVESYRQSSRSLASPTDMIRTIAATTVKPETNTASEVVVEPLRQIATISSGTPNVLLANTAFRQWVDSDLLAAYRAAVDLHVITEIEAASIPAGGGGANAFEDVLFSQEVVRSAGYNPDIVVVSPTDALGIQLLQLSGGDSYVFAQPAPAFVVSPSVDDGEGFVADASALGILFLSPFTLAAFEEEAGSTNTSTVRAESNGLFVVQRADAAATLSGSS